MMQARWKVTSGKGMGDTPRTLGFLGVGGPIALQEGEAAVLTMHHAPPASPWDHGRPRPLMTLACAPS